MAGKKRTPTKKGQKKGSASKKNSDEDKREERESSTSSIESSVGSGKSLTFLSDSEDEGKKNKDKGKDKEVDQDQGNEEEEETASGAFAEKRVPEKPAKPKRAQKGKSKASLVADANKPGSSININKTKTLRPSGKGEKSPGKGEKSPGKGEKSPGKGEKSPGKGEKSPGKGEKTPPKVQKKRKATEGPEKSKRVKRKENLPAQSESETEDEAADERALSVYSEGSEKKRQLYRPPASVRGVIGEISHFQRETHLLIPKLPFHRMVKEATLKITSDSALRYQSSALEVLQEAAEQYMTGLFEDSYLISQNAKRVTLLLKDMRLARRIRGEDVKFGFIEDSST